MESLGIKQSPRVKKTQFLRKTNAEKAMRWFTLLGCSSWISEQLNNVPVLPAERRKVRCRLTTTRCGNAKQHLHRAACTQSPKARKCFSMSSLRASALFNELHTLQPYWPYHIQPNGLSKALPWRRAETWWCWCGEQEGAAVRTHRELKTRKGSHLFAEIKRQMWLRVYYWWN